MLSSSVNNVSELFLDSDPVVFRMVCRSDLRADRIPRFFSVACELLGTIAD